MFKRKFLLIAIVAVALIGLAAGVGPQIYAAMQPEAPAPLTVASASAPASAAAPSSSSSGASSLAATSDAGTWKAAGGSQAGYRIAEVLNGANVTVVGRTTKVSGTVTVDDETLTAASIQVDVASIATDNSGRDSQFRGMVMHASQFPTASFALTEPAKVPALGTSPVSLSVKGTLELAGQKRDVVAQLQVVRNGGTVSVSGTIPITPQDFGITPPNLGFVKVSDSGQVEFLVNLTR
ncbi:MAG: YceI family protein [Sinomonas sp.]|nr:YceI family protein [Sinomonas sp.]